MTTTIINRDDQRDWFIDMSDYPVDVVAAKMVAGRLWGMDGKPFIVVHPDLWFDGVWVE